MHHWIKTIIAAALAGLLAQPGEAGAVTIDSGIEYVMETPDGETLVHTMVAPLNVRTTLEGWDLSMTLSYVRSQGGASRVADERRTPFRSASRNAATLSGATDTRISAERSIGLAKSVSLDLLARVTLPTGSRKNGLSRGQAEFMLDAGLRTSAGDWSLWAGGARRFRTAADPAVSGRDIAEYYAGAFRTIGKRASLRIDYLHAQAEYRGERPDRNISAALSRQMAAGQTLTLYGAHFSCAAGAGVQAGLSLSWPLQPI